MSKSSRTCSDAAAQLAPGADGASRRRSGAKSLGGPTDEYADFVRGLNHVELYVSNLDRSVAFWGWLLPELGYEPFQEWDSGRSWRLDDTYLVLVQAEPGYSTQSFHRKRPGLNHLAFWAKTPEQVELLPESLRSRGIPILYEDRSPDQIGAPSSYSVFFEDPDRIKVEVVVPEVI